MREETSRRYVAIPVVIWLLRLVAAVPLFFGIFTILAGGLAGLQGKPPLAVAMTLLLSFGPLVLGLVILTLGELLQVAIDIEENTRRTREELEVEMSMRRSADVSPAAGLNF